MSVDFNGDLRSSASIVPPYAKTSTSSDSTGGTWTLRTSGGAPRFPGRNYWRATIADTKSREEAHEDSSETFGAVGVAEGSRAFYALSVRYPSAGWYGTSNFGLFLQIKNKISNTFGGLSPQVALDHKSGVGLRLALRGGEASSFTSISPVVLASPPLDTWMDFILEVLFDRAAGQARLYYKVATDTDFTKVYENLSTPTMYIDSGRVGAEINPPNFCRIGYYRGPETTPLYVDHTGHIRTTTLAEAQAFFSSDVAMDVPTTTTFSFGMGFAPRDISVAIATTTTMSVGGHFSAATTDRGTIAAAGQGSGRLTPGTAAAGSGRGSTGTSHGGDGRGSPYIPGVLPLYPATDLYPADDLYPQAA